MKGREAQSLQAACGFQASGGGLQLWITPSPFVNKLCLLASTSRSEGWWGGAGVPTGSTLEKVLSTEPVITVGWFLALPSPKHKAPLSYVFLFPKASPAY